MADMRNSHEFWKSEGRYTVGVDLGQSSDPTAICVLHSFAEREGTDPADPNKFYFDVVHLQRLPLGWSYPAMVREIGTMLQRPPLRGVAELVIDETGVGRAVGDIFGQSGLNPIRVTITSGNDESMSGSRRYSVPKGNLISLLDAKPHWRAPLCERATRGVSDARGAQRFSSACLGSRSL